VAGTHTGGPGHVLPQTASNAGTAAAHRKNADRGPAQDSNRRPLSVNAGNGCSAVVKPREAVIAKLVTCWYPSEIERCEADAVGPPSGPRSLSGIRQTLGDQ
jgi:hypothetical protein